MLISSPSKIFIFLKFINYPKISEKWPLLLTNKNYFKNILMRSKFLHFSNILKVNNCDNMILKAENLPIFISFFFSKAGIKLNLFFSREFCKHYSKHIIISLTFIRSLNRHIYKSLYSFSTKILLSLYVLPKSTIWAKSTLLLFGKFLRRYLFYLHVSSFFFKFRNITLAFDTALFSLTQPTNEIFFHIYDKIFVGDLLLKYLNFFQDNTPTYQKKIIKKKAILSGILNVYNFLLNFYQTAFLFFVFKLNKEVVSISNSFQYYWFFFFKHLVLFITLNSQQNKNKILRTFNFSITEILCYQFTNKLVFYYRKRKYIKRRLYKKLIKHTAYRIWPF